MCDTASIVREHFFGVASFIPNTGGNHFFVHARMSNATIMTVLFALLAMIERLYDGFIGIGYIDSDHIVNLLLTYIQIYPIIGCYIYKYEL